MRWWRTAGKARTDGVATRSVEPIGVFRLPLIVVALGLALLAGGAWLIATELSEQRARVLHDAEVNAANLARALEAQTRQSVRRLDQALLFLRDDYQSDPSTFYARVAGWRRSIYGDLALLISIVDERGILTFTSIGLPEKPVDLSDRPAYRTLKDGTADQLLIGEPVLGRTTGLWSIHFSRRLNKPDGSFDGFISIAVETDYFTRFYDSLDIGEQGAVTLIGSEDRVVRARRSGPVTAKANKVGVRLGEDRPWYVDGGGAGMMRAISPIDGVERLGAYRHVEDYPLVVLVLYGRDEVLAEYRDRTETMITVASVFGLFILLSFAIIASLTYGQGRDRKALGDAQTRLATMAERWRLALDAVGDGVWDWNLTTDEIFFSHRWKTMLGHGRDAVLGGVADWRDRIHADDREGALTEVRRMLSEEGACYAHEHRLRCADGSYKWVLDRGVVVARATDGTPLRAVGTLTDITERRRMDEELRASGAALERSNQELEVFAYVASHDLRQPLRTISSYMQLLAAELGGNVSGDAREFMEFARNGAKRMDRLIVDLLAYSRVGRRGQPFAPVPFAEVIGAALEGLVVAVEESGAEVIVAPASTPGGPVLMGDRSELERLFQNLIGNAVKYRHPDRPPRVEVAHAPADAPAGDGEGEGGGFWEFTITDNGIGIAPEHFERVFGIFQRLHPAHAYEGSGIGLAVCRKIVERHGGRIWPTSTPGEGCVFHLTLPGVPAEGG